MNPVALYRDQRASHYAFNQGPASLTSCDITWCFWTSISTGNVQNTCMHRKKKGIKQQKSQNPLPQSKSYRQTQIRWVIRRSVKGSKMTKQIWRSGDSGSKDLRLPSPWKRAFWAECSNPEDVFSTDSLVGILSSLILCPLKSEYHKILANYPKDPSVLKIRIANLLRVVFLVWRGDLLSRRTLCGHHFSWELQTFFLSKMGLRRAKFGGHCKNTTA